MSKDHPALVSNIEMIPGNVSPSFGCPGLMCLNCTIRGRRTHHSRKSDLFEKKDSKNEVVITVMIHKTQNSNRSHTR
jgi:hypothetical protein